MLCRTRSIQEMLNNRAGPLDQAQNRGPTAVGAWSGLGLDHPTDRDNYVDWSVGFGNPAIPDAGGVKVESRSAPKKAWDKLVFGTDYF